MRETGKQVLGYKKNSKKVNDEQLEILSREKHKLQMDINSTTDMPMRKQKQKVLKDVKKAVKKRLREVENQRINNKMMKIEEMKNDSSRYFAALKEVQRERKQENLVVEDKNKKIAATEEVKIVSE